MRQISPGGGISGEAEVPQLTANLMDIPLLYRQLQDQLRQWVKPKDQRHLQGFAEIVAAILQSERMTKLIKC